MKKQCEKCKKELSGTSSLKETGFCGSCWISKRIIDSGIIERLKELDKKPLSQRIKFLNECYVRGAKAYEEAR